MPDRLLLLADNDPDYLDTAAEYLALAGYRVHKAHSPAEAREFLLTRWVHLAVLDIRLVADEDDTDQSGLLLAREVAPAVPKVVLTRYPTYQAARLALAPVAGVGPAAIDFVNKLDGLGALEEVLRKAFAEPGAMNAALEFQPNERQPITPLQLVPLLQPDLTPELQIDRAQELEDLFRRLFRDQTAISLERQIWQGARRVALQVTAFGEGNAHETLIVVCDSAVGGAEEARRYEKFAPHAAGETATVWSAGAATTHLAANAYTLAGNPDFATVARLIDLHRANGDRGFNAALAGLFQTTLPAWHQNQRTLDRQRPLDSMYRVALALDPEHTSREALSARLAALVEQLPTLGLTVSRGGDSWTVRLDGQVFTYRDPVAAVYQEYGGEGPAALLVTPGTLAGETILADEAGHAWLTDFAQAGRAPLLWNFVALEAAIRFDWVEERNLRRRYELEHVLAEGAFTPVVVGDVEPPVRRYAQSIHRLRGLASRQVAREARAYHLGILFQAARRLADFNPAFRLTPGELARLGQALFAVLMLGTRLGREEPAAASTGIRIDKENGSIWLGAKRVPLRADAQGYRLLSYLANHTGKLCSRGELVQAVLDEEYDERSSSQRDRLNVAIARLRERIEDDSSHPRYLLTDPGGGYRLVTPDS